MGELTKITVGSNHRTLQVPPDGILDLFDNPGAVGQPKQILRVALSVRQPNGTDYYVTRDD